MSETRLIEIAGRALGGGALPAVITPLIGATRAALMAELDAIVPKKPDLLEWRIDFFEAIGDVQQVFEAARAIRAAAGPIPILLTRRSANEGGQAIAIDEAAVVEMYVAVCKARCVEIIDYELSNDAAYTARLRAASRENGVLLILSYHNFQQTPGQAELLDKFTRMQALGADIAKVAVMPRNPQDVLTLLGASHEASRTLAIPLISMSMGGLGSLSRIMGWVYGSAATFAVGKSSSAPGQIAIEDLRAALATVRRAVLGS